MSIKKTVLALIIVLNVLVPAYSQLAPSTNCSINDPFCQLSYLSDKRDERLNTLKWVNRATGAIPFVGHLANEFNSIVVNHGHDVPIDRYINQLLKDNEGSLAAGKWDSPQDFHNQIGSTKKFIEFTHKTNFNKDQTKLLSLVIFSRLNSMLEKGTDQRFKFKKDSLNEVNKFKKLSDRKIKRMEKRFKKNSQDLVQELKGHFNKKFEQLSSDQGDVYQFLAAQDSTSNELLKQIKRDGSPIIDTLGEIDQLENELKELNGKPFSSAGDYENRKKLRAQLKDKKKVLDKQLKDFKPKAQQYREALASAYQGVHYASMVLGFFKPELAQKVDAVANTAFQVGNLALAIFEGGVAGAGFGPYGAAIGAVVNLVRVFSKKKGPNPHQIIMKQIQALSRQVEQMRKEMHQRFDRIEKIMSIHHSTIMNSFSELHLADDIQNEILETMTGSLRNIQSQLSLINSNMRNYVADGWNRDYVTITDQCFFDDRGHDVPRLTEQEIKFCRRYFSLLANEFSKNFFFSGHEDDSQNVTMENYGKTDSKPISFEYKIGLFDQILRQQFREFYKPNYGERTSSRLSNPVVWARGTQDFLNFRDSRKDKKFTSARIELLTKEGEKLQSFSKQLGENKELFEALFRNYKNYMLLAQKEYLERIERVKKKYYFDNFYKKDMEKIISLRGQINAGDSDEKERYDKNFARIKNLTGYSYDEFIGPYQSYHHFSKSVVPQPHVIRGYGSRVEFLNDITSDLDIFFVYDGLGGQVDFTYSGSLTGVFNHKYYINISVDGKPAAKLIVRNTYRNEVRPVNRKLPIRDFWDDGYVSNTLEEFDGERTMYKKVVQLQKYHQGKLAQSLDEEFLGSANSPIEEKLAGARALLLSYFYYGFNKHYFGDEKLRALLLGRDSSIIDLDIFHRLNFYAPKDRPSYLFYTSGHAHNSWAISGSFKDLNKALEKAYIELKTFVDETSNSEYPMVRAQLQNIENFQRRYF